MISFSNLDLIILATFLVILLLIGFYAGKEKQNTKSDFLLSGRKMGLWLFIFTNVSTWYGGILGVGEFTYRYGILNWFTQGLPYYIFAFLFALLLAKKVRNSNKFSIPEQITNTYGEKAGKISSIFVFLLVNPAPYILMIGSIFSLLFDISIVYGLLLAVVFSLSYLIYGGYKSDLYTDVFLFIIMFVGFIIFLIILVTDFGGYQFLDQNLPSTHLNITGEANPLFILVWFLIAIWTFADPGFHQRTLAARNGNIAVKGIIISILFWALFDFLTTGVGLYSRAILSPIDEPIKAFPLLAERVLTSGFKGIFFAAIFATILSTLNSTLFLSGSTIGNDFYRLFSKSFDENKVKTYTIYGMIISSLIGVSISLLIPSVVDIWYSIGSVVIPGIIFAVVSSHFKKISINSNLIPLQMVCSSSSALIWLIFKKLDMLNSGLEIVEPMLIGLTIALIIQIYGLLKRGQV